MLFEQTTDCKDHKESELPVTSLGESGAGLSGVGRVSLPAGSMERERLMSSVSGSLRYVAYEMVYVLRLPPMWRSSIPMQMLLMLLNTGLKQKLAWTLSKIQGIYRGRCW
ncbi:uncharacterized protein MONOS_10783 [Monocercomonoides exilis]|uniref:uncharacterized protein n=1 Tax=Monocercomonoides exilis TaxID=2049356 RepID=UPI00355A9C4D|nr:hypothetical protein MONOS_10783 [Monocercomonoides exilis]|eukprot:MONOS_10783.1-p1 / transcript=MONOS_10783.1 / gene=MONOS_10783 / organism=Monocercomonoides_exilis_PA203 / gene_product=unspecified product / transcript_product=unspecified product / location=Mono_scaffold00504:32408-32737(-) / protein_length=110 / sequence_SO=supercontig / SO=protein_coding / is_pseudo=false